MSDAAVLKAGHSLASPSAESEAYCFVFILIHVMCTRPRTKSSQEFITNTAPSSCLSSPASNLPSSFQLNLVVSPPASK